MRLATLRDGTPDGALAVVADDGARALRVGEEAPLSNALRRAESTGRPLGSHDFLERIAAKLGHDPKPGKRGPQPAE